MFCATQTTYSSVAPATAGPPPTTETCFVIRSCCDVADDDHGRLRPRRGIAVAVREQVRQLFAREDGLVRDQRAGRDAVVDAQVELHDGRLAGRQRALRPRRAAAA